MGDPRVGTRAVHAAQPVWPAQRFYGMGGAPGGDAAYAQVALLDEAFDDTEPITPTEDLMHGAGAFAPAGTGALHARGGESHVLQDVLLPATATVHDWTR
jgi:hypothetical protein